MKYLKFPQLFLLFLLSGIFIQPVLSKEKIKVLLLSGANNHNWKETTPVLQGILEESEVFEVTLTEEPERLNTALLANFDVIVSNWNTYPKKNSMWSDESKQALLDFISTGGGIVFVHAASSANYDWQAYQDLAGATWAEGTHHGKLAPFEVKLEDVKHPVTTGMRNFWIKDELWIDMVNYQSATILAQAFAPKSNKGNNELEPVIFAGEYGKGRSYYLVLGHNAQAMKNLGFQTLLRRGTEWSATGKVKQKLPVELEKAAISKGQKLEFLQAKHTLALLNNQEIVWQFSFNKQEGKPYFHPLKSTQGTELTWLRPEDHPWHRGIWFSWKFINDINYWEEDRVSGKSEGLSSIISVNTEFNLHEGAKIQMELSYHPPQKEELLKEHRIIEVSMPDKEGNYYIDWESNFTAQIEEVELDRTPLPHETNGQNWGGYAGFSARLNQQLWNVKAYNAKGESGPLHGTASEYITYEMLDLTGDTVSLSIFDHPDNFRHPNTWYIETSEAHPFYYFSPAPLFNSKLIIKKGESIKLKYRMLVCNGKRNQQVLQLNWDNFKLK